MRIVHQKVDRGFTIIPDRALTDARLSFRARGVLAYILSRPDGWETSAERLSAGAREGRDAVRTALRELEAVGYLRRSRVQDEKGRWSTVQVVTDTPNPTTGSQLPTTDSQPSVPQASLPSTETETEEVLPTGAAHAPTDARSLVAYFVRRCRDVFGTDPSGDAKGALGKAITELDGWTVDAAKAAIEALLSECSWPPGPHLTSSLWQYTARKGWDA